MGLNNKAAPSLARVPKLFLPVLVGVNNILLWVSGHVTVQQPQAYFSATYYILCTTIEVVLCTIYGGQHSYPWTVATVDAPTLAGLFFCSCFFILSGPTNSSVFSTDKPELLSLVHANRPLLNACSVDKSML